MSQVVYRGVAYDTEQRRQAQQQQQPQQHTETYRGVKFVKEAK
jgi:predicted GIY-YIG superfamily endonuclease